MYTLQKLQVRLSTFAKSNMKDSEREKWEKEMMSSEDSDDENDHNMLVKELPFRHESYFILSRD